MTGPWAQRRWRPERIACAVAALMVTLLIGYALVMGLRAAPLLRALADQTPLAMFDLKPPAPEKPKPSPPRKPREVAKQGGGPAAPAPRQRPNVANTPRPSPLIAPPPVIPTPLPPLQAAPAAAPAGTGSAGVGGSGSGGSGTGSGSGGEGSGSGNGEGSGKFAHARQTGGRFRNSDFPASAKGAGRLKIGVRYAIGPSGRVDQCEIIESSGYPEVDAMTCRIIQERYRFRPARDPSGYAVTEVKEEDYRWRVD